MACCEKYKPCILKYKALILKYVPYIFCEKQHLIFNDLQRYKKTPCFDACRRIVKSFSRLILQRLQMPFLPILKNLFRFLKQEKCRGGKKVANVWYCSQTLEQRARCETEFGFVVRVNEPKVSVYD